MKRALILWFGLAPCLGAAEVLNPGSVIQAAQLDETRPYFVATHPRVTTTVRFPGAIGTPEGAVGVFAEDARSTTAEYVIAWQEGDASFTVAPGREARLANLNVPYEGRTYVFYFYPATDALKAVAAVNLTVAGDRPVRGAPPAPRGARSAVKRTSERPERAAREATPARLLGLLDRLKLIHATTEGAELEALARAMGVEIAVCGTATAAAPGRVPPAVMDYGWYQFVPLRVVRDPRLNAIGFIGLLRNQCRETLVFDPASFGVRAGAVYYPQRISDGPAVLPSGAQSPVYFVVEPGSATPLKLTNEWRVSIDLLSPAPNPGAALLREYVHQGKP